MNENDQERDESTTKVINENIDEIEDVPMTEEAVSRGINDALYSNQKETARLASKPFIDHLDDAVKVDENNEAKFLAEIGSYIVIERYVNHGSKNRRWFDTRLYKITGIDHESGDLRLNDPEFQHYAGSNFKMGIERYGYRFKLANEHYKFGKKRKGKLLKLTKIEKKSSKKHTLPGATALRRIYGTKGVIHTRVKGIVYVSEGKSRAKEGERLMVSVPSTAGMLTITHPDEKWIETWRMKDEK